MPLSLHHARWTSRTLLPPANARHRLLVVDDYRSGAEAISDFLSLSGYDARFVTRGAEVWRAVAAHMPEIAVLDINMPGMDGFAVAQRLRRDPRTQLIVIVAFTAQEELDVRRDGIAAGFDGYCKKHGNPGLLLDLLVQMNQ
ncbi:response regulator [Caballeronia glebae]|uniref:response regulator n=1 Tax=Caballeronia glebae TaxID=1777143 RepID=UPI0038BACF29